MGQLHLRARALRYRLLPLTGLRKCCPHEGERKGVEAMAAQLALSVVTRLHQLTIRAKKMGKVLLC